MKTPILLAVLSIFVLSSFSVAVVAIDIPVLQKYVNDRVGVISSDYASSINQLAASIEQNSTVEIAVLVVNTTQPSDMNSYALSVFRENGVGKKDNNNGLLIVIAVSDREWRIEVGYGLEGLINDAKAGTIGRTYLVPQLQSGNYGKGIYDTVAVIGRVVSGEAEVISDQGEPIDIAPLILPIIWVLFILIGIASAVVGRSPKCPKCGTRMKLIKDEHGEAVYECPKDKTRKKAKKRSNLWMLFLIGGRGGSRGGFGGGGFGGGSGGGGGAGGKF